MPDAFQDIMACKIDEIARLSRANGRLDERAALADIVAALGRASRLLREADALLVAKKADKDECAFECMAHAEELDRLRDEYHKRCLTVNLSDIGA